MLRGPIRFTNALGGTASFIYPGPTIDMQSPASAGAANGATYVYYAQSLDMTEWETGNTLYNSGTGTFARTAVTANSLGTTAKIDFTNPPQVFVFDTAAAFVTAADVANFVAVTSQVWTSAQQLQAQRNIGIPVSLRGAIDGLILSTAGGSSSFSVANGVATADSATDIMVLSGALSKTTAAWAVGSGNGGLDTGAIADGWYHVWLIKRPDTGVVEVCFSLSAVTPNLTTGNIPVAYTLKRLIGSIKNVGGNWLAFTQVGNEIHWAANIVELGAAAIGSTAANIITLAGVPTGINVIALFHGGINPATPNGVLFTSLDENDVAVLGATGGRNASLWAQTALITGDFAKRTNASAQIRWRTFAASGDISIYTFGFIHSRGRDA